MFGLRRHLYRARRVVLRMLAKRVPGRLAIGQDILIVAPHPDDETFGAGTLVAATMKRKSAALNGRPSVHVVFLTSGNASHRTCCHIDEAELSSAREATATRATATLGVPESNLHFLRLPDGQLPRPGDARFDDACLQLADLISRIKPRQVFTTHPFEAWPDHLAAEQLTRDAMRQSQVGAELYHYCVWFWIKTPLQAVLRVDWANAVTLDEPGAGLRKEEAIGMYLTDVAPCGRPYCGTLVKDFLQSFEDHSELFFRVPIERS